MSETLDQVLRALQGAQSLGLENKIAVLDRLCSSLAQGASGSPKALDGIITALPSILGSSQVIASQAALACIQPLVEYVTREANMQATRSLIHFILPSLLDRLGDGRMAIRELTLTTLRSMWAELQAMHCRKSSLDTTPSPTRSSGSRYSAIASSIPKFTTPFKSRILKPKVPTTSAGQWNPVLVFEREIQTRGFAHKIWRVREMVLEWLNSCVEDYPEFPASHYFGNVFTLLDDNQDAVRFASKRVLNTIYHARTELQQEIISRAQALVPSRPTLVSAITAPAGELAAMPASPYGNARSGSRLGTSLARPGSRVAGQQRSDSRLGGPAANGMYTGPPVPQMPSRIPDPGLQVGSSSNRPSYRSMSQLGVRPGSRTGYSSPLSPGRASRQQSPMHPPMHPPMPSLPPPSGNGGRQQSPYNGSPTSHLSATASSLSNRRSSHALNPRNPLSKQSSQQRLPEPFIPSKDVPNGVRVHNVPSKQSLASEFLHTIEAFGGRESEDNWIQRERAIGLYRGIVWGNAAIEFGDDLVGHLKDNMLDVFKVVNSLRTSLSASAMCLCEDIAMRLGPHASPLFDTIVDALVIQCAQTKKISAQRAAKSMEVVFHYFPLRAKAVDALRVRMQDKSAILRQAVVTTCTSILRSHGYQMATIDRRYADVLAYISEVVSIGVVDAQPLVRETARELFWALHYVSELQATSLLATFPESTRTAITRDKLRYARDPSAGDQHYALGAGRSMSAASIDRSPATPQHRLPVMRTSFSSNQASPVPSLMSVVADHSPQRSPGAVHSGRGAAASYSNTPLQSHSRVSLATIEQRDRLGDTTSIEQPANSSKLCDIDSDDLLSLVPRDPENHLHMRVNGLRVPVQARMSLGLIDFSQMEIGASLSDVGTPPHRSMLSGQSSVIQANDFDASASALDYGHVDSQATAVTAEPASISTTPFDSSQLLESTQTDSDDAGNISRLGKADTTSVDFGLESTRALGHILTPARTPLTTPSPRNEPAQLSPAAAPASNCQFVTPRTQTARYWHGPIESLPLVSGPRLFAAESPMPVETPQRLGKVERYLQHLASNDDVDEALFRSLARFAKEESSNMWIDEAKGGGGYLDRILQACLGWLQNPAESRDTVFAKDSCFDVLRVLVRRKSQHFSLDTSRRLLLEVLRNKFFESTILSGSAEDVFYDMATHLDVNLCFELAEDFFKRALLPPVQSLAAQRPGYATQLLAQIPTPPDMDPMGVFAMDNALAGVLEFVAEVMKRLSSPDAITARELAQFMPYAVVCFIHPRSQVRKAALTPMIAVHEKLGVPDAELELLLLRAGPDNLAASSNPLARYVDMLHRPELRRLAWAYYLSKRDA
ncbi:suppressor of tub2 mutation [Coemansia aciculifera]|uniref:Suppressor of tub2 mutation n=1 Tax=Coemansia aciculifera TaxID=417176 RepID=A0A9W8M3F4_9FUNG|nr:suppressor of tub2 mutation [Coemansia aciculifera]KAJ2873683.1 suppressor of tub2 mutation [Coemansia aciculifera]